MTSKQKHHSAEWCSLRGVRRARALAVVLTLRASRQKGPGT